MNRFTKTIAILGVIFLAFGCEKDQFKHKHFDFSYADNIAGTYVGIRKFHTPGKAPISGTITVVVEDRRSDKVCNFYIDYFNREFNVKPNGVFEDKLILSEGTVDTYNGYFKDGILYYSQKTEHPKNGLKYYPITMKLYKQ